MKWAMGVMCVAASGMAAGAAWADGGGDIGARVDGGRLVTWAADHDEGVYLQPERVFKGELADIGGVIEGDEPGFFYLPNFELSGAQVGLNVRAAARLWDPNAPSGAAGENFQAIAGSTLTIGNAILGSITTPAADPASPLVGPSITVPSAGIDFHYPFVLNGTATGIYLLELELRTNLAGVGDSLPFWVILNYGLPEAEHDRAKEYVESFVVPAPGAAAVLAMGLGLAARRRR